MEIQALIVCPTGIGTSKMLASRIRKEIPEINSVVIKSVKEIKEAALEGYDVVISTVRLPFFKCRLHFSQSTLNRRGYSIRPEFFTEKHSTS